MGQVVAYEVDHVSDGPRLDWSVVVIGVVDLPMAHVLRIRPQLVTGYVLDTRDVPASA